MLFTSKDPRTKNAFREEDCENYVKLLNGEFDTHQKDRDGQYAVDTRKLTIPCLRFAKRHEWIKQASTGRWHRLQYRHAVLAMPIDVIWHVVQQAVPEGGVGRSISKNKEIWRMLNIWEEGSPLHKPRDIEEMEHILIELEQAGYVRFQCAGSVWDISRVKRPEEKTCS